MADNQPNNDQPKSEYGELTQFLIGKFDKSDEKFSIINEKFNEINTKLENKADKSDVDKIMNRIGMILDQTGDYRAQQLAIQRQVDRHA